MDTVLFLYAESPIHAGGSESLGAIDLPIQRESTTGLPVIWGQSLKGALRERARTAWADDPDKVEAVFGSRLPDPAAEPDAAVADEQNADLKPGTLSVGDAQLVAFPVPTLQRCFAWVTSPLVLSRLARKLTSASSDGLGPIPSVSAGHCVAADEGWAHPDQTLGPFVLPCELDNGLRATTDWLADRVFPSADVFDPFRRKARIDTLLADDGVFAALTAECTEVAARVQLKAEQKSVANGPFYSENLPAETVLAAMLSCSNQAHLDALTGMLEGQILRIGGDETIGKGLAWCRIAAPSEAHA